MLLASHFGNDENSLKELQRFLDSNHIARSKISLYIRKGSRDKTPYFGGLLEYIVSINKYNNTPVFELPADLQNELDKANQDLEKANRGISVSLVTKSIYYSSDAINAAENRLNEVWKKIDRYNTKKRTSPSNRTVSNQN